MFIKLKTVLQVGGWSQSFGAFRDGKNITYLTYATVRGAAHEVPYTTPSPALTLFQSFLTGSPLPNRPKHWFLDHAQIAWVDFPLNFLLYFLGNLLEIVLWIWITLSKLEIVIGWQKDVTSRNFVLLTSVNFVAFALLFFLFLHSSTNN